MFREHLFDVSAKHKPSLIKTNKATNKGAAIQWPLHNEYMCRHCVSNSFHSTIMVFIAFVEQSAPSGLFEKAKTIVLEQPKFVCSAAS